MGCTHSYSGEHSFEDHGKRIRCTLCGHTTFKLIPKGRFDMRAVAGNVTKRR